MENEPAFGRVPASVTFGTKIFEIPTLEEMGVPIAGLTVVTAAKGLTLDASACWVNRGDVLVTYEFRFFLNDSKPRFFFLSDRHQSKKYSIRSPISGLALFFRQEETVTFTYGLQYQWCNEYRLPILLIPNDEPPPSADNFHLYDDMCHLAVEHFEKFPVRDHSSTAAERLKTWLSRQPGGRSAHYAAKRRALEARAPGHFRNHRIREIAGDDQLISRVQDLRASDIALREKLVHIARAYGQSC